MALGNSTLTTPLLSRNSSSYQSRLPSLDGIQCKSNEITCRDESNFTNERLSWRDLFRQILVSGIAFMLVTQPGINMVYFNIFLHHNEFTNFSELSWFTSILVLCTPVGAILIGVVMDQIGRRNACLLTCVPLLISWSISSIARSDSMNLFYASRFFAGIGGGMTSMVVVYISEIAHASYKQVLLSLNSVFFSIGVLFATTVGSLVQWRITNVVFLGFTVVTTMLIGIFLPESPAWLIKFRTEQVYKARCSLKTIYPKNNQQDSQLVSRRLQLYEEEWVRLNYVSTSAVETDAAAAAAATMDENCGRASWFRWRPLPPSVSRPMRVLASVFLLQQLSGCYPVIFYAVPVFKSIVGSDGNGDGGPTEMDALVTLGVVRLVASVTACALSLHVGRRPLMIASSLAMACSSALVAFTCSSTVAGGHDAIGDAGPLVPAVAVKLLPLVGLGAFVCSSSAGVLVFPWTLVGELLPVPARAVAGALIVSYAYGLMFVVLRAFPYALECSVAGVFGAFAAASLAMAAYVYRSLPETLGKRFHEIEEHFADPPPQPPDECGKTGSAAR